MTDISVLEGWLLKKKDKGHSRLLFGDETRRWFKVQKVMGSDEEELALCYFKSNKEKDPKGWIFLKDITEILEGNESFTIVSNSRSMTLEAETRGEHRLWLKSMISLCPSATIKHGKGDNADRKTENDDNYTAERKGTSDSRNDRNHRNNESKARGNSREDDNSYGLNYQGGRRANEPDDTPRFPDDGDGPRSRTADRDRDRPPPDRDSRAATTRDKDRYRDNYDDNEELYDNRNKRDNAQGPRYNNQATTSRLHDHIRGSSNADRGGGSSNGVRGRGSGSRDGGADDIEDNDYNMRRRGGNRGSDLDEGRNNDKDKAGGGRGGKGERGGGRGEPLRDDDVNKRGGDVRDKYRQREEDGLPKELRQPARDRFREREEDGIPKSLLDDSNTRNRDKERAMDGLPGALQENERYIQMRETEDGPPRVFDLEDDESSSLPSTSTKPPVPVPGRRDRNNNTHDEDKRSANAPRSKRPPPPSGAHRPIGDPELDRLVSRSKNDKNKSDAIYIDDSDDSDEEGFQAPLDFKEEKKRYAASEVTRSVDDDEGFMAQLPGSKPPRHPRTTTAPAAIATPTHRKPLSSGDNSIDKGFVSEDWDDGNDDDDDIVPRPTSRRREQQGWTPKHGGGQFAGGVRPDDNFMGEDWDD